MTKSRKVTFFFGVFVAYLMQLAFSSVVFVGDYNKDFMVLWGSNHINTSADGHERSLVLDKESGAGFASNDMFLFGEFDMQIKLVPGRSAGTVVAFYLRSNEPNHDEIDFEFLGNVAGKPYILQTNVFADGFDNREERIHLWFDPTKEFHTYSIHWNLHQIVFMVDWVPIRVYRNHADKGVAFPRSQPMALEVTLWNGESWATNGGRDKIDWSKGPFVTSFGNYKIDGCVWRGNARFCRSDSDANWWNKDRFSTLTMPQRRLFKWVKKYYSIYDYCNDYERFHNNLPEECSIPKY
ncbi:hypothetical protein GIB67_015275 [Kingdonia uniflora]|uniref:Xyloglucan endotransglucosylase/hydrolase n=1 Tax=Kingdonia uniflora TaxID=39325 RepID=A0A7J7MSP4_9MAGN|nr:hypothetical protein GIB67_015275 [Kingdonia uniflora]